MNRRHKEIYFFIALIILGGLNAIVAQAGKPVLDSIYSKVLSEQRNVRVILPQGYTKNTKKTYDVIYVLDGQSVPAVVSKIHDVTSNWKEIPKCIIVGIDNKFLDGVNQRSRDLTPTHMNRDKLSGKADNYIAFIKKELIPYIDKTYPTSKRKTLFGHSHGGTFAIYSLLKDPTIFNAYIAADPSLWWDNEYINKLANEKISHLSNGKISLFVAGREGRPYKEMGIESMEKILIQKASKKLLWKSNAYENETHITVILKAAYDGLKFVYKDF